MAASDYTVKASSAFCPLGILGSSIDAYETDFPLSDFNAIPEDAIEVGSAAMINDEIVKVVSFTNTLVVVERGCADTIPQPHDVGSKIWFFDDATASDSVEYAGTSTISVKIVPRTATGGVVPIDYVYPNDITFNLRFARPYPPGKLRVNGNNFNLVEAITPSNASIVLTWKHRNRVTQADILFGHEEDSISPETGQSYTLRFYSVDGSGVRTLVRTVTGVTAETYTYTRATMLSDLGVTTTTPSTIKQMQFELETERDGYTSWQKYVCAFTVDIVYP